MNAKLIVIHSAAKPKSLGAGYNGKVAITCLKVTWNCLGARRCLVVIDGSKGLRAEVKRVFGAPVEVQGWQIHKRRNSVAEGALEPVAY